MAGESGTQEATETTVTATETSTTEATQTELPLKKETAKAESSKTESSSNGKTAKAAAKSDDEYVPTDGERILRRENESERKRRETAENRAAENDKLVKELQKYKDEKENAELAAQKKHEEIADKERKAREKAEKELESERATNKRERLLDKAETFAAKQGIRDEAIEDLRVALERRVAKEDISLDGLSDIIEEYKTSKPHWFKVAETKTEATATTATETTKTAEEKPKKATSTATPARKDSGTEAKTDWNKSTPSDWRAHMASMGVRV